MHAVKRLANEMRKNALVHTKATLCTKGGHWRVHAAYRGNHKDVWEDASVVVAPVAVREEDAMAPLAACTTFQKRNIMTPTCSWSL